MRRIVLFTLLLLVTSVTAQAKTAYRFAAICEEGVCLVGADGKSRLVLAKDTTARSWTRLTVSPSGRMVAVASESVDRPDDDYSMDPSYLYRIDPHTGKTESVPCKIEHPDIPENPVWLDDQTVLLETFDEKNVEVSVYAVDVETGKSRLVVPPREEEWTYDGLMISPDRKLLATQYTVTAHTWISAVDMATGKQCWSRGHDAFTGMTWSPDGKSLVASRYRHGEEFPGPGGIWKYDALTGAQKVWKYPGEDIWGMWSSPDGKTLALDRRAQVEFLRTEDGKSLARVKIPSPGNVIGGLFTRGGSFLLCGDRRIAKISLSDYKTKSYPTQGLAEAPDLVRLSPDGSGVIYTRMASTGPMGSGVISLATGEKMKLADDLGSITWLPKDIVR